MSAEAVHFGGRQVKLKPEKLIFLGSSRPEVTLSVNISSSSSRNFNRIQARLFYRLKVSGTIKASAMKLCTVIVLLKAY